MYKNITYAEKRHSRSFDWNEFLKKKTKTPAEIGMAIIYASNWISCACGNQCYIIPRHSNGTPIDEKLFKLGVNFYISVKKEDWKKAKSRLAAIEKRSTTLINQIIKTKKHDK